MSAAKNRSVTAINKLNQSNQISFENPMPRSRTVFPRYSALQLALLALLILIGAASARAQSTDAVITGTVTDSGGGALQGVTVTATNTDTQLIRTTVSGDNGQYRVAPLPPGTYTLTTEKDGFRKYEKVGLELLVNVAASVTVKLDSCLFSAIYACPLIIHLTIR